MRPHVAFQTSRAIDSTKPPGAEGNFEVVRTIAPEELSKVDFTPDQYAKIVQGLRGVTQDGSGTAYASFQANPTAWPMAGKTGTAEVNNKADTSVFAGWGPSVDGLQPQYVVSVFIPESGFGSDVAAPVAFEILAPASRGELLPTCPVLEPEKTECETRLARDIQRLTDALAEQANNEEAQGTQSQGTPVGGAPQ